MSLTARCGSLSDALEVMRRHGDAAGLAGSIDWIRAAATTVGESALLPILFRDGDRSVGATVLESDRADWRTGSPTQRRLRWPLAEFGYHFAPVLPSEHSGAWIQAIHQAFPQARLELCRTAATDATPIAADGAPTFSIEVRDVDSWRAGLRGEHRRDLGYYQRRLLRRGVTIADACSDRQRRTELEVCFDLHARRVRDKNQSSLYLTARGRTFLTQLVERLGSESRITVFRLDERPIAACLAFLRRGHYSCFMPGWDPAHRDLDLGRQVIYHQVLTEFERGLRCIDLLGGDLPYKREFGATAHPTTDVVRHPSRASELRERVVTNAVGIAKRLLPT